MNNPLANRYARALLGAAQKQSNIAAVEADLTLFAAMLLQHKYLFKILAHPVLDFSKKTAVAQAIFGGSIHELTMHFLNHCILKKRILYFQDIARNFSTLCHASTNTVEIIARSAFALPPDTRNKISKTLTTMLNKTIKLTTEIDTALLAGVQLWMGDTVIDLSVASQLKAMQEKLSA
jgi:F-type H+-transporting ATPase subunit delta